MRQHRLGQRGPDGDKVTLACVAPELKVREQCSNDSIDSLTAEDLLGERVMGDAAKATQFVKAAEQIGHGDELLPGVRRRAMLADISIIIAAKHLAPNIARKGPE